VKRSAVLKDVPHPDLESKLGNLLQAGWTVLSAHPSTLYSTLWPYPDGSTQVNGPSVVFWTIFLETEYDNPTEVP
jgi:hypothetical protein